MGRQAVIEVCGVRGQRQHCEVQHPQLASRGKMLVYKPFFPAQAEEASAAALTVLLHKEDGLDAASALPAAH